MSRIKTCGIIFLVCSIISAACSSSLPGIDHKKFNRVGSAAQKVRSTLISGGDYQSFCSALQEFSAEITALKDKAGTDQEKDLLNDYSDLNSIYHDGVTLWKYKIEFKRYGFVPPNLIYVGQDIEPIVTKYRIPTELHVYAPTQQSWRSIPAESIQMIWTNADSQFQIIHNILIYSQPPPAK